ncbi:Hypothetical protein NTJ_11453 [Nesidiocoris tenuis]|uniref:CTNNB1 binding N-teminal domain-containing protein n=1 Tax=Nesidiocoris tenuis TaxID=355587 RepID=A0ABN7B2J6_9HEMI|nr:Hypothetical protein NTJ_11453 [Nesidiocoris tenuis]
MTKVTVNSDSVTDVSEFPNASCTQMNSDMKTDQSMFTQHQQKWLRRKIPMSFCAGDQGHLHAGHFAHNQLVGGFKPSDTSALLFKPSVAPFKKSYEVFEPSEDDTQPAVNYVNPADDRSSSANERSSSAIDRSSSAIDRSSSANDRSSSANDRSSSANDRTSSDYDYDSGEGDHESGEAQGDELDVYAKIGAEIYPYLTGEAYD